jgi:hypothetical protein
VLLSKKNIPLDLVKLLAKIDDTDVSALDTKEKKGILKNMAARSEL